jgi:hypothetical protein
MVNVPYSTSRLKLEGTVRDLEVYAHTILKEIEHIRYQQGMQTELDQHIRPYDVPTVETALLTIPIDSQLRVLRVLGEHWSDLLTATWGEL